MTIFPYSTAVSAQEYSFTPPLPVPAALGLARARRSKEEERLDRDRPVLTRLGLTIARKDGQTILVWAGGAEVREPRLSAYLDQIEWLEGLPGKPADVPRPANENRLTDYDRERLGLAYFETPLGVLGAKVFEDDAHTTVMMTAADGTVVSGGRLDAYLLNLERARRLSRPLPAFKGFDLVPGVDASWAPAAIQAKAGDHVSLRLSNPGPAEALFRLEGYGLERRVLPGSGTIVSVLAEKSGDFLFYDPGRPSAPSGTLSVQPAGGVR